MADGSVVVRAEAEAAQLIRPLRLHLLQRANVIGRHVFDPSLGWNIVAPGRVKVEVIPGTHETMVTEPHVHVLAQKVIETMREAVTA